jgi:hypothetical protein
LTYNGLNIGEGYDEFERYDAVKKTIEKNQGKLTREQTIDLLAQVGVHGPAALLTVFFIRDNIIKIIFYLEELKAFI